MNFDSSKISDSISPLGSAAIEYAKQGFHVFPCGAGSKAPAVKDGSGHHEATTDVAQISRWWQEMPNANIGVNLRKASLAVIDVDIYKPECEWLSVIETNDLPSTLTQKSPSGGLHYIFRVQEGEEFPKTLCKGVDIKRNGYILLEPSVFNGSQYQFENDDDPVDIPDWVARKPKLKDRPPRSVKLDSPSKDRETWEILDFINPDQGGYDAWLEIIFAIHDRYDGNSIGFEIAETWSAQGDLFDDDDIRGRWDGIKAGAGGVTWATACSQAREAGADLKNISEKYFAIEQMESLTRDFRAAVAGGGNGVGPPIDPDTADEKWKEELEAVMVRKPSGSAYANLANVYSVMDFHPDWDGCFAFDEFSQKKILTYPIPGSKTPRANFKGREFKDDDYAAAQQWFQRNGFAMVARNSIVDAVNMRFQDAAFNSLKEFVRSLPLFDPVKDKRRIGTWLHDYCGVETTGDEVEDRYVREVGARWLMSAVARAIKPGCKVDTALILEGPQGAGKSTALAALAGKDWFGDSLPPMGSKDAKEYVRGKWIIEMAELANMNKTEVEEIKAFMSRRSESFRPAYGREEITYPRQCVLAGTTNRSDYLRDETGNRRFWPVKVGAKIDVEGIKRDRLKLWAEAAYYVNKGDPWWLPEDVEATQRKKASERLKEDAWHADIERYCEGKVHVCTAEIYDEVLAVSKDRRDTLSSNRITAIFRAIGFSANGRTSGGQYRGNKRFSRFNHD